MTVRLEADSDFADLFEVKDALKKQGEYYHRVEDGRLVIGYRRETYERETWISATADCKLDEAGLTFAVHIEPHGEWTTDLHVVTAKLGAGVSDGHAQVRAQRQEGQARHGTQPRQMARRRAPPGVRLGPAQDAPTSAAWSTSPRCASRR